MLCVCLSNLIFLNHNFSINLLLKFGDLLFLTSIEAYININLYIQSQHITHSLYDQIWALVHFSSQQLVPPTKERIIKSSITSSFSANRPVLAKYSDIRHFSYWAFQMSQNQIWLLDWTSYKIFHTFVLYKHKISISMYTSSWFFRKSNMTGSSGSEKVAVELLSFTAVFTCL